MNAGGELSVPAPPLVVHLLYRLDFGGLETVLAECINRMPAEKYRHAIVCLTDYTAFSEKITKADVLFVALHKPPGLALGTHVRLWRLLRRLRPVILHTYNLSAVEYAVTAAAAGVPIRIHAEHGRDLSDPDGTNRKHNFLRRLALPFIDCMVPVSGDLQRWLGSVVGVPAAKNQLINNGVDTTRFHPRSMHLASAPDTVPAPSFEPNRAAGPHRPDEPYPFVIGTVGRIQDIKNHKGLVQSFLRLRELLPEHRDRFILTIAGDGPLMKALQAQVAASGAAGNIRLLGARTDIDDLMRSFDAFALPSFAEGTPITLLEAMACGLPVVASRVGGIPEVVTKDTGVLVNPTDHDGLAAALAQYFMDPPRAAAHGAAGRRAVEDNYSVAAMLTNYMALYDALCLRKLRAPLSRKTNPSCAE